MEYLNLSLAFILSILCARTDLKDMIIPNKYTYPALVIGIVLCLATGEFDYLFGGLAVFATYLIMCLFFSVGMGDLKLATALAFFLGAQPVIYGTLVVSAGMCVYGVIKTFLNTGRLSAVFGVLIGKFPAGAVPFGAFMGPASVMSALVMLKM
mgnify:CR=1 FL=1